MPVLENAKQERFCQLRAEGGLTIDAAHTGAGYKPNRHNAARMNTKEHIRARIAEIQGVTAKTIRDIKEMAREYTEGVLENLWEIHNDKKAPKSARVMAGQVLLDRGHGKVGQQIEAEVSLYDSLDLKSRLALVAALDALIDDKEGDATQH